jgi:DNA-binding NarL/FixJ family response regulator
MWGVRSTSDLSVVVGQDVRLVAIDVEDRPLTDASVRLDVIAISEMFPHAAIAVISDSEEDAAAQGALKWGVRGFFPSSLPIDVLVAGFRLVLAGGVYCPPPSLQGVERATQPEPAPGVGATDDLRRLEVQEADAADDEDDLRPIALTRRETEVMAELQLGHSNKVIALKLGLSENTVKMHIQHLMRKLGARTRTEAVFLWARRSAPLGSRSGLIS